MLTYRMPQAEDLPWTPLDLRAPVGLFTGPKLAGLASRPQLCTGLLRQAAVSFRSVPAYRPEEMCGWTDAVRLASVAKVPRPADILTCPMAAGYELWMRRVVQPAAIEMLGARVTHIDSLGSYACRLSYGRSEGRWSQHASANAIDIAGFLLSDGRRITLARNWHGKKTGPFLRHVRDGACRLFATTLSPDYNAAHRDHLHLDMTPRPGLSWNMCE